MTIQEMQKLAEIVARNIDAQMEKGSSYEEAFKGVTEYIYRTYPEVAALFLQSLGK